MIYIHMHQKKDFKITGPTGNSENSEPQMEIEPTTLCHLEMDAPTTELLETIEAFKMMKNGIYFIVIALLVGKLFEILIYAN